MSWWTSRETFFGLAFVVAYWTLVLQSCFTKTVSTKYLSTAVWDMFHARDDYVNTHGTSCAIHGVRCTVLQGFHERSFSEFLHSKFKD